MMAAHTMATAMRERLSMVPPGGFILDSTFFVSSWLKTYRNAMVLQMQFERPHARLGVVKDRRGERGVGAAGREHLHEMIEAAGAARGDHGNGDRSRHGGGERAVEPGLGAIAVDRREENLTRAPAFGFACPLDGVAVCRGLAAACVHLEPRAAARPRQPATPWN